MSTAILEPEAPAATEAMPTLTPTRRLPAVPTEYDRIVLTGFMGSGKSTIGALLAEKIGWTFLDLDREIERREGRSVPQIFSENGESAFRKAETSALASVLGQRHVVIALGGGAPEELGNRLLLEQTPKTAVVYLSADFETLVARCHKQAEDPAATARPVLADRDTAAARFVKRKPHYERIASHILNTASHAEGACVEAVLDRLHR